MLLLNSHDSFDLTLPLLDCLLHTLVVATHAAYHVLVLLLLADDASIAATLHESVDFNSTLLIRLLLVQTKACTFSAKQIFKISQVGARLNLGQYTLLNFTDLGLYTLKELGYGALECLRDHSRRNLVHILQ